MAYQNDIPKANDRPSISQGDIKDNFTAIKTYVDRDHVAISTPGVSVNEGKHKKVTLRAQSPSPTTVADEGMLFTKDYGSATPFANLYWKPEPGLNEVLMTNNINPLAAATGYTFLPAGIVLQWGRKLFAVGSKQETVTFPVVYQTVFQVVGTLIKSTSSTVEQKFSIGTPSTTGFTAYIESHPAGTTYNLSWIALGTRTL